MIARLYAAGARARRRYYASRPHLQRRLSRPVISIGNIAVGGRAKTPLAALVATRLLEMGERPAILSRGYARRDTRDGVVVVRDQRGMRADLDRAGDEPLMLARQLDGVAVLVSSSRYLAGRLAEHHFGCTVHVLDDGFQHFDLRRDADIVVVAREDLDRPETLPSGRLREPFDAVSAADAIVALGDDVPLERVAMRGRPAWRARRRLHGVQMAEPCTHATLAPGSRTVYAVAGIADPGAFFRDLRAAGWTIAGEASFRDHHAYSRVEALSLVRAARDSGAHAILTTEKDLVRLLPFRPFSFPLACVPLAIDLESPAAFDDWLAGRLALVRQS